MRNILLILLIGVLSCQEPTKENEITSLPAEKPVVKVRLTDLNDQPIDLDQYKGQTVFINFWATWCKPCLLEMPSIDKAQELLHEKGVVFLLASNENLDQINEFKKGHKYKFNYVRLVNMEELNVEVLPTTYIFNPKGQLVLSETGYRKWDEIENIEKILKISSLK